MLSAKLVSNTTTTTSTGTHNDNDDNNDDSDNTSTYNMSAKEATIDHVDLTLEYRNVIGKPPADLRKSTVAVRDSTNIVAA